MLVVFSKRNNQWYTVCGYKNEDEIISMIDQNAGESGITAFDVKTGEEILFDMYGIKVDNVEDIKKYQEEDEDLENNPDIELIKKHGLEKEYYWDFEEEEWKIQEENEELDELQKYIDCFNEGDETIDHIYKNLGDPEPVEALLNNGYNFDQIEEMMTYYVEKSDYSLEEMKKISEDEEEQEYLKYLNDLFSIEYGDKFYLFKNNPITEERVKKINESIEDIDKIVDSL